MTGMRLFGRRWGISSDDFVFPELFEGFVRLAWWILVLCLFATSQTCAASSNINVYLIGLLVSNGVTVCLCFALAFVSSRGTIINATPRRNLAPLIYIRLPLLLFDILWNVAGSSWSFADHSHCETTLVVVAQVTAVLSWFILAAFLIGVWMVFDPLGTVHHDRVKMDDRAKQVWKRRLRLLCCCAGGNDDNMRSAFESVAELMADFFSDTDLVFTDIWAGIVLMVNRDFNQLLDRPPRRTPVEPPPEWMNLRLAHRYMQFALGTYGWPYYLCDNFRCSALCALAHHCKMCYTCRCDQVIVLEDNSCMCNTAALKLLTGIEDTDLFYVSFHNRVYEVPFVACVDQSSSAIVVAIRGSLSLKDAITDMCLNDEVFELPFLPGQNATVHRGMLRSAEYVYAKLCGENILNDLFILHPTYDLVITGHSLGAGVAALLSLMLKAKYPNLRCFAFSPPGCVMNETCLPASEDFICSLVMGNDLIGRLSRQTMIKFKSQIISALENCDRPKHEILLKGCWRLIFSGLVSTGEPAGHDDMIDQLVAHEESYERQSSGPSTYGEYRPIVATTASQLESSNQPLRMGSTSSYHSFDEGSDKQSSVDLHIPGRILHIVETRPGIHQALWNDQSHFQHLLLTSTILSDHKPYVVAETLKRLASQEVVHA